MTLGFPAGGSTYLLLPLTPPPRTYPLLPPKLATRTHQNHLPAALGWTPVRPGRWSAEGCSGAAGAQTPTECSRHLVTAAGGKVQAKAGWSEAPRPPTACTHTLMCQASTATSRKSRKGRAGTERGEGDHGHKGRWRQARGGRVGGKRGLGQAEVRARGVTIHCHPIHGGQGYAWYHQQRVGV